MDVSFIIVSYNSADLITRCINSILALTDVQKEIFVIDNNSVDGSADVIHKFFPQIHLAANKENIGFGPANNRMLPLCQARYIFFLNPDTQIKSNSLKELVAFMDDHPQIGLSATKIIDKDGSLQWSVSDHYPGQKYAGSELKGLKGDIACVLGASMIARTALMKQIGGFDEDFFLYGEDIDLCLRIRKAGYEIGFYESFIVEHLGGHSERDSGLSDIWFRKLQAEYIFYEKHYTPETIRQISRENRMKSWWRIFTLHLAMPFLAESAEARRKLIKYRTILKAIDKIERDRLLETGTQKKLNSKS
jgi:N-acetylglucosaminyl-diphospho-decaprenol L-rhamnosyltransferase